jgi:hypothetical protein
MTLGTPLVRCAGLAVAALFISGCRTSGESNSEEIAPALSYLQAEPGVGSTVTRGNKIYIGFTDAASDRGAIVRGAALNAADAAGADAWVFATGVENLDEVGTSREVIHCYSHAAINEETRRDGSAIRHSFIKEGSC